MVDLNCEGSGLGHGQIRSASRPRVEAVLVFGKGRCEPPQPTKAGAAAKGKAGAPASHLFGQGALGAALIMLMNSASFGRNQVTRRAV